MSMAWSTWPFLNRSSSSSPTTCFSPLLVAEYKAVLPFSSTASTWTPFFSSSPTTSSYRVTLPHVARSSAHDKLEVEFCDPSSFTRGVDGDADTTQHQFRHLLVTCSNRPMQCSPSVSVGSSDLNMFSQKISKELHHCDLSTRPHVMQSLPLGVQRQGSHTCLTTPQPPPCNL